MLVPIVLDIATKRTWICQTCLVIQLLVIGVCRFYIWRGFRGAFLELVLSDERAPKTLPEGFQCLEGTPAQRPIAARSDSSATFRIPKPGECNYPEASTNFDEMLTNSDQVCELPQRGTFSKRAPLPKRTHATMTARRLALLLRGESFRDTKDKGIGERSLSDRGDAYQGQKNASKSHMDFIVSPWEECGFKVDVFIASYIVGNATTDLLDWYGGRVVASDFVSHDVGDQASRYMMALDIFYQSSSKSAVAYDAFIITRPDVIFKAMPMPPGAPWNRSMFLFHEWEFCGGAKGLEDQPAVDTFLYVPWKHFNCAFAVGFTEHHTFNAFKHTLRSSSVPKPESQLDFFFPNEWHDTNSYGDWNPVYNLVRKAQVSDIHGHVAAALVGVSTHLQPCQACVHSLFSNVHLQGDPRNDAVDWYIHSWSPSVANFYKDRFRDRFKTFRFQNFTSDSAMGFFAWGVSTLLALQAVSLQESRKGPLEYCTRPAVDYDLVMIFRDDVVLRCQHNVAWYKDKIPLCQGWKVDCTINEPVVGLGFAMDVSVDKHARQTKRKRKVVSTFPAVPSVVVTNSYGARRIASRLAVLVGTNHSWPHNDASEAEVLSWFRMQFKMPVLQVCRGC